jgi:hypothetical protein
VWQAANYGVGKVLIAAEFHFRDNAYMLKTLSARELLYKEYGKTPGVQAS